MKYQNYDNNIENLLNNKDPKVIESDIIRYIVWLKNDQKLSGVSVSQYITAIIHFYSMNDITLNRKKIGRYMGDYVRPNKDRAYSYKEILKLLEFCDERAKALVLLLSSTGIRIGAIPSLAISHLQKIEEYNLYKVIIYEGTKEEYFTFCTPEAAAAIDTYLDYRQRAGEKLADNAPLIRQQFDSLDVRRPKPMTVKGLSKLLEDKLLRAGVTTRTNETETTKKGQKRNVVARAHGFRKFVETNMVRIVVRP